MFEQLAGGELSLLTYIVVFAGGFTGGLSPCSLPTVLLVIGYVGGNKDSGRLRSFYLSLSFVLGIAFTLTILGMAASYLGGFLVDGPVIWYVVAFIAIIMGFYLLGYLNFNLSLSWQPKLSKNSGLAGAFLLGLPFGLAASPCTTPITATLLAFAAARGEVISGMLLLFVYAIGRSIPLLLAGTFAGFIKNINGMMRWNDISQKASGLILIGLGLYFLWLATNF